MIVKPSILSGFLELLPKEQILFNNILDKIRLTYEKFGFAPIDTPLIEKSEILLAKAGGETEKQIYRFTKGDNDLSLRFDLTVPLARYVAQHFGELTFPFRRYHIGKVYRGERPQRGRFREFYQCDIDIVGNENLNILNDAELPSVIYSTFTALGFDNFTIRINNRKILNGFFEWLEVKEKSTDILRAIDKLEKIGKGKVVEELNALNLKEDVINKIIEFVEIKGNNKEIILKLNTLGINNDTYTAGVKELSQVIENVGYFNVPQQNYAIDLTIARGLDYYTGTVYETILNDYPQLGSVCSGGRYDDLASNFTDKKLPGVGVSIGLSRLFYQLNEAQIIKADTSTFVKVLVIPMTEDLKQSFEIATMLRNKGINTEIFLEQKSIKHKFSYADKLKIPYVIVIGEDEVKGDYVTLKDMVKGEQHKLTFEQALSVIIN